MDVDLVCNFKKCRKRLGNWAWVTSCSHIFCDEDGTREFNKAYSCPACETNLSNKFDILRIDLQPSEQSKSMLLAGHKPDTILEVCSRAMAFWTYQTQQELMYQSYVANKSRERNTQMEQHYNQTFTRFQTELSSLKTQLSDVRKELSDTKKRYNEVSEKLMDRSRQYQKLQTLYDGLRRRTINPAQLDADGDQQPLMCTPRTRPKTANFNMGISASVDDIFNRRHGSSNSSHQLDRSRHSTSTEGEFVFRPASTPTVSGSGDASRRFHHPVNDRRPRT